MDETSTDGGQARCQNVYMESGRQHKIAEWVTFRGMRAIDFARVVKLDKSTVSKIINHGYLPQKVTVINRILQALTLDDVEHLYRSPTKDDYIATNTGNGPGKSQNNDKNKTGKSPVPGEDNPSGDTAGSVSGVLLYEKGGQMLNDRMDLIEDIAKLPVELVPVARELMKRLKGLPGSTEVATTTNPRQRPKA